MAKKVIRLGGNEVMRIVDPAREGGRFLRPLCVEHSVEKGEECYTWAGQAPARRITERVHKVKEPVVLVRTRGKLELGFSEFVRDCDGSWDLRVEGTWSIRDVEKFTRDLAMKAMVGSVLTEEEMWACVKPDLTQRLSVRFEDILKRWGSVQEIILKKALGGKWWKDRLNEQLERVGLEAAIRRADLSSPDKELADRKRREEQIRRSAEEAKRRIEELEDKEKRRKEEREAKLREIEHNSRLDVMQKKHELEMLELQHMRDREGIRTEIELIRKEREVMIAKLEAEKADDQRRRKLDEKILKQEEEIRRLRGLVQEIGELTEDMRRFVSGLREQTPEGKILALKEFLTETVHISPEEAEEVVQPMMETWRAERVTELPGWNFAQLVAELRDCPRKVQINYHELRARTLLTGASFEAVRVRTPITLEIVSPMQGHLTLLNLGTSGDVVLLVPNAYCDEHQARIKSETRYTVPGEELLPRENLYEQGPPGWERVVALVTSEPLWVARLDWESLREYPLAILDAKQYESILGRLQGIELLAFGELSFMVEN